MKPRGEVVGYLPSVPAAVDANLGLPSGEPAEIERFAALHVRARVLRREGWSEIEALPHEDYERLKDNRLPAEASPGGTYHVVGEVIEHARHWVRCRLEHYFDKSVALDETWVPSLLGTRRAMRCFEAALEGIVMVAEPPECLRCLDLTPRAVGGAYRSMQGTRAPDFYGFDFGDALATAEQAVHGLLRGHVVSADIRAYAWPLLWLRYEQPTIELVVFADPGGKLHAYSGETPADLRSGGAA